MAIQTAYPAVLPVAYAGMPGDMRNSTSLSREVMAVSSPLGFGVAVFRGTTDHTCCIIGTTGAGTFLGISEYDDTVRPLNGNFYVAGDSAAVKIKGNIWVPVAAAVANGAAVYYDAGGLFTSSSSSTTAVVGAIFESSTTGAGMALIRL